MAAADEASRLYKEKKNPIKKQSAKEECEQMAKATATIVRSFRKKYIYLITCSELRIPQMEMISWGRFVFMQTILKSL